MIFEPLYSPDLGLVGFRCRCGACTRVVRTQRGAEMHCWRKHKIKVQMEMSYGEPKEAAGVPVREPIRASVHDAAEGEQRWVAGVGGSSTYRDPGSVGTGSRFTFEYLFTRFCGSQYERFQAIE